MDQVQKGVIGLKVTVPVKTPAGTPFDLTNVASIVFVFGSPAGDRFERTATIQGNPTLGVAVYPTTANDLTVVGAWRLQVRAVWPSGETYFTQIGRFLVKDNI
jgi:hypothetical protein